MEDSGISEAKKGTSNLEQGESDVDSFLWSWRRRSPRVRTRRWNCQQGVLRLSSSLAAWCGAAQATCVVEVRWQAAAPRHRLYPLVPPHPELLGKMSDPTSARVPLFTWHCPMWHFIFPKVKMLLKENRFRHGRGKMKCDDTAVGCSKESVPKVLWTMEGLLEQVFGVWRRWRELGLQHHRLVCFSWPLLGYFFIGPHKSFPGLLFVI